jgi:hypothetical protein
MRSFPGALVRKLWILSRAHIRVRMRTYLLGTSHMLAVNSQDKISGRHHIKVSKFSDAAGVVAPGQQGADRFYGKSIRRCEPVHELRVIAIDFTL